MCSLYCYVGYICHHSLTTGHRLCRYILFFRCTGSVVQWSLPLTIYRLYDYTSCMLYLPLTIYRLYDYTSCMLYMPLTIIQAVSLCKLHVLLTIYRLHHYTSCMLQSIHALPFCRFCCYGHKNLSRHRLCRYCGPARKTDAEVSVEVVARRTEIPGQGM